jgi:hypothetical protein
LVKWNFRNFAQLPGNPARRLESEEPLSWPSNSSISKSPGEISFEAGVPAAGPAGMAYFPSAHWPKSMSLQRSEQNGRAGFSGENSVGFPQRGHFTFTGSAPYLGAEDSVKMTKSKAALFEVRLCWNLLVPLVGVVRWRGWLSLAESLSIQYFVNDAEPMAVPWK